MVSQSRIPVGDSSADPLAIRFVNTLYGTRGTVRDGLTAPGHLAGWLRTNAASLADAGVRGVEQADVSPADLDAFIELRETIRSLIRAATDGHPLDPAQVTALNATAALAPAWPVLMAAADGATVARSCAALSVRAAVLGTIAADAVRLLGGPGGADVRACQAPGCVQFFVRSQSRRAWCSAACGNRARVAHHYRRHKGGPGPRGQDGAPGSVP